MSRLQAVPGVQSGNGFEADADVGSVNGGGMYIQGRSLPRRASGYNSERDDINRVIVAPSYFATIGDSTRRGTRVHRARRPASPGSGHHQRSRPRENSFPTKIRSAAVSEYSPEDSGKSRSSAYCATCATTVSANRRHQRSTCHTFRPNPADLVFTVRTAVEPASGHERGPCRPLSAVDPNIPIVTVETQMSQIERRYAPGRVLAQAYTLFGGIALFVAAIGLFGLMSYNVSRRTREIGIRMAMGAAARSRTRPGAPRVNAAGRWRNRHRHRAWRWPPAGWSHLNCSASNRLTRRPWLLAIAVMTVVSAAAGYLPARRATRVDPMVALGMSRRD